MAAEPYSLEFWLTLTFSVQNLGDYGQNMADIVVIGLEIPEQGS